jgi:hypothetical protein
MLACADKISSADGGKAQFITIIEVTETTAMKIVRGKICLGLPIVPLGICVLMGKRDGLYSSGRKEVRTRRELQQPPPDSELA